MSDRPPGPELGASVSRAGWCCSYCGQPLEAVPHGLLCTAEGRWFATHGAVHRLLPDERRREIQPALEMYQRVRRDEGWRVERGLPDVPPSHPHADIWRGRAARFRRMLELLVPRLGPAPWRVLEVGAGCCWASVRLLERGHEATSVDVNLDPSDGLPAADLLLPHPSDLPRAEAEMEALPLEPGRFDLVLAAGALHHTQHLTRVLVELRRVTRRGGWLAVLDSPVYRRRQDGEAMVADRMREHARRYGFALPRDSQSSYLVLGELPGLFRGAGWTLEAHGWPGRVREWAQDVREVAHWRRRTARFPLLLAQREG